MGAVGFVALGQVERGGAMVSAFNRPDELPSNDARRRTNCDDRCSQLFGLTRTNLKTV
jgi:hypothetical protein